MKMIQVYQEDFYNLSKMRIVAENELVSKRKEVIDLTAELDRARRKINMLEKLHDGVTNVASDLANKIIDVRKERDEAGKAVVDLTFKLANIQLEHQAEKDALIKTNNYLIQEQSDYEDRVLVANEAWQEKVNMLEEQITVQQVKDRYLKPVFLFMAGFTTAAVLIAFIMRG